MLQHELLVCVCSKLKRLVCLRYNMKYIRAVATGCFEVIRVLVDARHQIYRRYQRYEHIYIYIYISTCVCIYIYIYIHVYCYTYNKTVYSCYNI